MIPWLDSNEDVSRYLRGGIDFGPPADLKSQLFFEVLLLLVICGCLAGLLSVSLAHLWQGRLAIGTWTIKRPIHGRRLKRRIHAIAQALSRRADDGGHHKDLSIS